MQAFNFDQPADKRDHKFAIQRVKYFEKIYQTKDRAKYNTYELAFTVLAFRYNIIGSLTFETILLVY